jgi:fatty-acyl-CoA synthase
LVETRYETDRFRVTHIVTARRFKPEATLRLIADHRADMLVTFPTMLHRMVELGPDVISAYDTSSLKVIFSAGSALSPQLSNRAQDTIGDVLYNIYASTECGLATIATPSELRSAPGTAGRPPVTSEVVLFDARPTYRWREQTGPDLCPQPCAVPGVQRRPDQADP